MASHLLICTTPHSQLPGALPPALFTTYQPGSLSQLAGYHPPERKLHHRHLALKANCNNHKAFKLQSLGF